jgi:hypothetical protein
MVLLDRSKLRLKAATAKLKKQRQCNMRPLQGTNVATEAKKAQKTLPIADFQLPISESRHTEIGNRQLEIGNPPRTAPW